jgi:myo-inositol-1-phosphate synthase
VSSKPIRLGIVGVGNCASSLVQGLTYYRDTPGGNEPPPGLMNIELGGYHVGDIEVASAFDVAAAKVGRDVAEAIAAPPNNIKSQVGATIIHRVLTNLFRERGVRLDRTYQLNFGGNTDFENMLERERLESKKISKTQSVMSQLDIPLSAENVHVGPSDYVPWLSDRKWAYIRLEGTTFGGVPLNAEVKLEVWDSPNSAGIVIDAVRCARLGLDRGIGGALIGPSSYFMKSPPEQFTDAVARERTLRFIAGDPPQGTA